MIASYAQTGGGRAVSDAERILRAPSEAQPARRARFGFRAPALSGQTETERSPRDRRVTSLHHAPSRRAINSVRARSAITKQARVPVRKTASEGGAALDPISIVRDDLIRTVALISAVNFAGAAKLVQSAILPPFHTKRKGWF